MLNIGVGSILTNGLGGSAYNLLTFGPFNIYIEPLSPPEPTPEPTPEPQTLGGAIETEPEETRYYKLTLTVSITKRRTVTKTFTVDKDQQEVIIRRLGKINTAILKFNVVFRRLKKVFTFKWKK